jgi:hypothetical protein
MAFPAAGSDRLTSERGGSGSQVLEQATKILPTTRAGLALAVSLTTSAAAAPSVQLKPCSGLLIRTNLVRRTSPAARAELLRVLASFRVS